MKSTVLDASALVIFLENTAGAWKVEAILKEGVAGRRQLWMSAVNLGEVFYSLWRRHGESPARKALEDVLRTPLTIVPATLEMAQRTGAIRAQRKLPYADCYAAALALEKNADLVTADQDFKSMGKVLRIVWI